MSGSKKVSFSFDFSEEKRRPVRKVNRSIPIRNDLYIGHTSISKPWPAF
jgi:hypothetical protein